MNWYLNNNFRLMFDYEMVSVDKLGGAVQQPGQAAAAAVCPGATPSCQAGQDLNIFSTRASFAF